MLISGAFIFIFSLICEGHSKVYHHYKRIGRFLVVEMKDISLQPVVKR